MDNAGIQGTQPELDFAGINVNNDIIKRLSPYSGRGSISVAYQQNAQLFKKSCLKKFSPKLYEDSINQCRYWAFKSLWHDPSLRCCADLWCIVHCTEWSGVELYRMKSVNIHDRCPWHCMASSHSWVYKTITIWKPEHSKLLLQTKALPATLTAVTTTEAIWM